MDLHDHLRTAFGSVMSVRSLVAAALLALAAPALAAPSVPERAPRAAPAREAAPSPAPVPADVLWGLGVGAVVLLVARIRRRPPSVTA